MRQVADMSAVVSPDRTQSGKSEGVGRPIETGTLGDPGMLVPRALAILAEERDAWRADRASGHGNLP
jgi:hypothetical protein